MIKSLLPKKVKVNITVDDISIRSNLITNKTIRFNKKSFLCTLLGFTQSHSGPPGDLEGFIQMTPGKYKSNRPINIKGILEIHLECAFFNGSIVNGIREQFLNSFVFISPPGHKKLEEPRIKLFQKIK